MAPPTGPENILPNTFFGVVPPPPPAAALKLAMLAGQVALGFVHVAVCEPLVPVR
jgi:hypothetical protein